MCEFCDPETKNQARRDAERFANTLNSLAREYKSLAIGETKPHSDDTKAIKDLSKVVIKKLVEWI